MYSVNFQKAKRNFMTVTFEDEKPDGTTFDHVICVGMPKKRVFDKLMDLSDMNTDEGSQSEAEKNQINRQKPNMLYETVAEILSNSMGREKITTEWVGDMMSTEDIKTFMQQYAAFARGEATNPN